MMLFLASKILPPLLLPSNLLILLGLAGIVLMLTGRRRAGLRLAAVSLLLLAILGFGPIGPLLTNILENRFPAWDARRGPPDGIVVLGSAINPVLSRDRDATALNGAAERVTIIAKLARDFPNARIVFTSGDASLTGKAGAEADYLPPLLDTFGVPRGRVALETHARNTAENAAFSKALADPKPGERWLLVTSAQHMPRAIGCFRRIGFTVEAYPVDWRTRRHVRWGLSTSLSGGLARTDDAVHEWLGLLAYWLIGRTDRLLPGP
jgi:uncharacterized SAM-binding protein YcdF (DUF218 family)